MKVLTLHQPHAALVAAGVATIHTDDDRAPADVIGQRIGIASSEDPPEHGQHIGPWTAWCWDSGEWTLRRWVTGDEEADPIPLPLGCIVATAVLDDCVPMVGADGCKDATKHLCIVNESMLLHSALDEPWADGETEHIVSDQLPYGDFRPGRWAWLLRDVEPVTEKCPACGQWSPRSCPDCQDITESATRCLSCGPKKPHTCTTCRGYGCDPIPFKGGQGLSREWTP